MSVTLSQVGIRVDENGAIATTAKLDKALEKLGVTGDRTKGRVDKLSSSTDALTRSFGVMAGTFSAALILTKIVRETEAAQAAQAQLEAGLRSTGNAVGFNVQQLNAQAAALQKMTVFSDDAVTSAQSLLLTFTQIRGDVFRDATVAITDMAARMGGDLRGAALQLGKALQDPITGLSGLGRAGIQFTDTQKNLIKQLVETGQTAAAQRVILKELELQLGGSAVAARNTLGGALAALKNAWGDLFEVSQSSSGGIIAALDGITSILPKVREGLNAFFGGVALLAVDAAVVWQLTLASWRENAAKTLDLIGGITSTFPKLTGLSVDAFVAASNLRKSNIGLAESLETWRQAEYAKIVAMGAGTKATIAADNAGTGLKKTAEELAEIEKKRQAALSQLVATGAEALQFDALRNRGVLALAEAERTLRAEIAAGIPDLKRAIEARKELASVEMDLGRERERRRIREEATKAGEGPGGWVESSMPGGLLGDTIRNPGMIGALDNSRELYRAQAEAWQNIWTEAVRGVQQAFASGFERIFSEGLTGFRSFAESVVALFRGVAAQIASALVAQKLGLDKILAQIQAGTFDAKSLPTSIRYGGGAVVGATTGYQSGIGAGVLSGAVAGAALGGPAAPLTALLGAAAGLAGGLLGAAAAAKQAASQLREMGKAVDQSIGSFKVSVSGDSLTQGVVAAQLDAVRLISEIMKAFGGHEQGRRIEEVNALTQKRIELLTREAAELQVFAREDMRIRGLRAGGFDDEADAAAAAIANERELAQARRDGMDEATIAWIVQIQAAEAVRRAADAAKTAAEAAARAAEEAAQKALEASRSMEDLTVRRGRALGDPAAEDLAFRLSQQREREDAVAADRSPAFMALLAEVQRFEAIARDQLKVVERQTMAIEEAAAAAQAAYDQQISTARSQLDVAKDQLRTTEQAVAETRRVIQVLTQFSDSLKLDSNLTPLGPIAQLAEARAQFNALMAQAQGGDKDAAGGLPAAARALLEASRGVNASTTGYVNDFAMVQAALAAIAQQFTGQLTTEEQMLVQLQQQTARLEAQIAALESAKAQAAADAQRQVAALEEIARLQVVTQASTGTTDAVIAKLEQLRLTADASGQAMITSQTASLVGTRDALNLATAAQVAAINAGANAATLGQLDQIRVLELARNDYNTKAVQQITELAAIHGYGSAQVAALEKQRVDMLAALAAVVASTTAAGESVTATNSVVAHLISIRQGADAMGQALIATQVTSLQATSSALAAASAAQVAAVKAGADLTVLQMLGQVTAVEQLRNDANTKAVQQIAELAAIKGWGSAEVAALELARTDTLSRLDLLREQVRASGESAGNADRMIAKLEEMRQSATIDTWNIIGENIASLAFTRQSLMEAQQSQVDAVRAGADANTLNQLSQITKLEQQRNDYNVKANEQISRLATIYGWQSYQVINAQTEHAAAMTVYGNQLTELRGVNSAASITKEEAVRAGMQQNRIEGYWGEHIALLRSLPRDIGNVVGGPSADMGTMANMALQFEAPTLLQFDYGAQTINRLDTIASRLDDVKQGLRDLRADTEREIAVLAEGFRQEVGATNRVEAAINESGQVTKRAAEGAAL